jgi:hypothetical protein
MSALKTKTPRDSQMETRYLVMPQHANDLGIVFGGTIMSWIDALAGMVAQKHCERKVLTVSTDRISFLAPVHIGDHVVLDGRFAFKLPEALATEWAGPLLCGGITVYSALRHAGMTSGQEIGVLGLGGLGRHPETRSGTPTLAASGSGELG